jgi:hypothetical protein
MFFKILLKSPKNKIYLFAGIPKKTLSASPEDGVIDNGHKALSNSHE